MRPITLAVLAGGAGSRMGRAKARLDVRGRPILNFLLDRWRWAGPTMLVTAPGRENPPGFESFTRQVMDPTAGAGPLRGIVTALEACATELLIIATCDMPLVSRGQFDWLAARLDEQPDRLGVILHAPGNRIEPFPMALRSAARDVLSRRLEAGLRSVRSLANLDEFDLRPAPDDWPGEVWTNLNQPEDVSQFLAMKADDR
jgi:molybdopterin-guanine dinucleotide biosynthesis protein A